MTTIVADRKGMAADSLTVIGELGYHAPKMIVVGDAIIAGAGEATAIKEFFEWWPRRHDSALNIKKKAEFQGMALTKEGIFVYGNKGDFDKIDDPYMAIGSGSGIALGAMDTMLHLGHAPDVRLAVEIACHRSPQSDGPVAYLSLKQARKQK